MKIVSVILARGGSKGIKGKNIKPLNGKPLIEYTINASLNSKSMETWVCTDDDLIAKISRDLGAKILMRPKSLATDFSPSEDSLIYFANEINFDYLVFIQPTSPQLTSEYINIGIDMMINNQYESVFSGYKDHWVPKWIFEDHAIPYNWDINKRPRRQDVKTTYVENGAFYVTTKESLIKSKLRYSGKIGIVEMPMSKSFQVDTEEDITILEKLL